MVYLCLNQLFRELCYTAFSRLQLCSSGGLPLQSALRCARWTAGVSQRGFQLSAARPAGAELLAEVSNQGFLVCVHSCQEIHLSSMLLLRMHGCFCKT